MQDVLLAPLFWGADTCLKDTCATVVAVFIEHDLPASLNLHVAVLPLLSCLPRLQDVVLALLFSGANTSLKDARGFDVMIEAARGSRDDIIEVLRRSGARTGISIMLQVCVEGGRGVAYGVVAGWHMGWLTFVHCHSLGCERHLSVRLWRTMIEVGRGSRGDIIEVLRRSGARTGISIMLQVRVV
jgi:hypothetical protein